MNTNFYSLWFDPPGIEPESTASVADALSTRPLIGLNLVSIIKQIYYPQSYLALTLPLWWNHCDEITSWYEITGNHLNLSFEVGRAHWISLFYPKYIFGEIQHKDIRCVRVPYSMAWTPSILQQEQSLWAQFWMKSRTVTLSVRKRQKCQKIPTITSPKPEASDYCHPKVPAGLVGVGWIIGYYQV